MPASRRFLFKLRNPLLVAYGLSTLVFAADLPALSTPASASFQTVSFYGEYYDHAVRWPNGKIRLFDKSGFKDWTLVLERLQPFLSSITIVQVDHEGDADIIVESTEQFPLPYLNSCGVTQNYIGSDNASIMKSRVKIKRTDNCIGEGRELGLYMHEFGHALGFSRHTKDNDVMGTYENKGIEVHIQTLSAFLTGLYKVDTGAPFPLEKTYTLVDSPTDWSVATGKVLSRQSPEATTPRALTPEPLKNNSDNGRVPAMPGSVLKNKAAEASQKPGTTVRAPDTKTVEKIVVKKQQEEQPFYLPLSANKPLKMRQITVISPNGVSTKWVIQDSNSEAEDSTSPRKKNIKK